MAEVVRGDPARPAARGRRVADARRSGADSTSTRSARLGGRDPRLSRSAGSPAGSRSSASRSTPCERPPRLARRAAAEALGAFALVFAGCGAIVTDAERAATLGTVGVGLVFGLVILAADRARSATSRARTSTPAVTPQLLPHPAPARHAMPAPTSPAQLAGATAGALLLWLVWPAKPADLGATVPTIAAGRALIVEGVLTALLMLVILSVATDTRAVGAPAAIAIGGDRRPRRAVRRPAHGRVDEPGAVVRPRAGLRAVERLLGLPRRARCSARRSARSPTSSSEASTRCSPAAADET